jgi:hypothetical protein
MLKARAVPGGHLQVCLFRRSERKWLYVHRIVGMHHMQNPDGHPVLDHRDRQPSNNHVDNLRFCTPSENGANTTARTGGTSRFKGVSWNKRSNRWTANIRKNRKSIYLGTFVSEEDAAKAYDAAARQLFGEFANGNFPEESSNHATSDPSDSDSSSTGDAPELAVPEQNQTAGRPADVRVDSDQEGRRRLVLFT